MNNLKKAKTYLSDVLEGRAVVGKWIRLVVERHYEWLKNPDNAPGYFDEDSALRPLTAFELFRRTDGTNEHLDLMPWQAAILYLAYGWRKPDGSRLTNTVYCEVARGNAKTEFLAGVGNYGFLFDGVDDSEVWWVATKKDQSKIGWDRQKKMLTLLCNDSPAVKQSVQTYQYRIKRTTNLGCVGYLGKDKGGDDGLKPYYGLIDEYHAHEDNKGIDILESGMVKRKDPMTWIITTQGYLPEGPNSQFLKVCKNILEGKTPNPEILPFLFELDEGDDWRDESVWPKANPALGVTMFADMLHTRFEKAKIEGESKIRDFKIKNLNLQVGSEIGWIKDEDWQACPGSYEGLELQGRDCIGGLDLAITSDVTAFAKFFPSRDGVEPHVLMVDSWLPEEKFEEYTVKYPVMRDWHKAGWLTTTPGNVTDYQYIQGAIEDAAANYNLQGVAYDRHKATPLLIDLADSGVNMIEWNQNIVSMSRPTKEMERLVMLKMINHGGNPVLRWMVGNVAIKPDANGNYKPLKDKSHGKIDGVVAAINAIGYWLSAYGDVAQSALFNDDVEIVSF